MNDWIHAAPLNALTFGRLNPLAAKLAGGGGGTTGTPGASADQRAARPASSLIRSASEGVAGTMGVIPGGTSVHSVSTALRADLALPWSGDSQSGFCGAEGSVSSGRSERAGSTGCAGTLTSTNLVGSGFCVAVGGGLADGSDGCRKRGVGEM